MTVKKANVGVRKDLYKTIKALAIAINMSLSNFIVESLKCFLKTKIKRIEHESIPLDDTCYICFYADAELLYGIKKLAIDATSIAKTGITVTDTDVMRTAIRIFLKKTENKHKRELKEIGMYAYKQPSEIQFRIPYSGVGEPVATHGRVFKTKEDIIRTLYIPKRLYDFLHEEAEYRNMSVVRLLKEITESQEFQGIYSKKEKITHCVQWVVDRGVHARLKIISNNLTIKEGHRVSINDIVRGQIEAYSKKKPLKN